MKKLAIIIAVLLLSNPVYAEYKFAENWSKTDTFLELVNQGLFIIDWGQTRHMARMEWNWDGKYYNEMCPFLSKRPSTTEVDTMIPMGMAAHLLISLALPPDYKVFGVNIHPRRTWQLMWIGIEAGAIGNNFSGAGVRIEF